MPVDHTTGRNDEASARTVTVSLGAEDTEHLLRDVPGVYRTQINDVLLTAFVEAFASWTGHRTVLVDLEGHGREELFADVDVTRTVGWFTSLFPVVLSLEGASGPGEALKSVKEQLRAIPERGVGYGLLRWRNAGGGAGAELAAMPEAEVVFNYLGQFDQPASVEPSPATANMIATEEAASKSSPARIVARPAREPAGRPSARTRCAHTCLPSTSASPGAAPRALHPQREPPPPRHDRGARRGVPRGAAPDHRPLPLAVGGRRYALGFQERKPDAGHDRHAGRLRSRRRRRR